MTNLGFRLSIMDKSGHNQHLADIPEDELQTDNDLYSVRVGDGLVPAVKAARPP